MSTIKPIDLNAPGPAETIVNVVKSQMGGVPNIFATMAQSPSVLEGFLAFSGALRGGSIPADVAEQIALAVAGKNHCDYCASAHSALAAGAGLDDKEIALNLSGVASDAKVAVMLMFATDVVQCRGQVSAGAVEALRVAGVTDAEFVELIAHICLNLFTNYFNHIAQTEIDFPLVKSAA